MPKPNSHKSYFADSIRQNLDSEYLFSWASKISTHKCIKTLRRNKTMPKRHKHANSILANNHIHHKSTNPFLRCPFRPFAFRKKDHHFMGQQLAKKKTADFFHSSPVLSHSQLRRGYSFIQVAPTDRAQTSERMNLPWP